MSVCEQVIEIPPGCGHYKTMAWAESRATYDSLTAEDGWVVESAARTGKPDTVWKEATIRGHWIVVFPPVETGL